MHQAAQHDERRLNKYCIIHVQIINFWSYSPLQLTFNALHVNCKCYSKEPRRVIQC